MKRSELIYWPIILVAIGIAAYAYHHWGHPHGPIAVVATVAAERIRGWFRKLEKEIPMTFSIQGLVDAEVAKLSAGQPVAVQAAIKQAADAVLVIAEYEMVSKVLAKQIAAHPSLVTALQSFPELAAYLPVTKA